MAKVVDLTAKAVLKTSEFLGDLRTLGQRAKETAGKIREGLAGDNLLGGAKGINRAMGDLGKVLKVAGTIEAGLRGASVATQLWKGDIDKAKETLENLPFGVGTIVKNVRELREEWGLMPAYIEENKKKVEEMTAATDRLTKASKVFVDSRKGFRDTADKANKDVRDANFGEGPKADIARVRAGREDAIKEQRENLKKGLAELEKQGFGADTQKAKDLRNEEANAEQAITAKAFADENKIAAKAEADKQKQDEKAFRDSLNSFADYSKDWLSRKADFIKRKVSLHIQEATQENEFQMKQAEEQRKLEEEIQKSSEEQSKAEAKQKEEERQRKMKEARDALSSAIAEATTQATTESGYSSGKAFEAAYGMDLASSVAGAAQAETVISMGSIQALSAAILEGVSKMNAKAA